MTGWLILGVVLYLIVGLVFALGEIGLYFMFDQAEDATLAEFIKLWLLWLPLQVPSVLYVLTSKK